MDPVVRTAAGALHGRVTDGVCAFLGVPSMPRAEGLFRRAIAQSGAAHHVVPVATARRIGRDLAARLRVPPSREAMAAVPVDQLLTAQAELKADLMADPDPERWSEEVVARTMPWQPVVDGDVIPGPPIDRIAGGAGGDVELIVGTNSTTGGCSSSPRAPSTRSPRRP